ncbi:MAG: DASS family sodium-coupled anion symporter [Candidatus Omnitrophota bacterium]|jgi:anion transporter|nr:MAG: DASS family sodium-coupled anion symporter [Candidatus Omnitrophota bacterium]
MVETIKNKITAYDRYIDYKRFFIASGLFLFILLLPVPSSMLDVAVEYTAGKETVENFLALDLFHHPLHEIEQWQKLTVESMNAVMMQGISQKETLLKRKPKDLRNMGIVVDDANFNRYQEFVSALEPGEVNRLLTQARALRHDQLQYDMLSDKQKERVDTWAKNILVCIAMVVFVVVCFITEAMPLPGVAFCIGLILVFSGIVSRNEIAQYFWSDAVWFIMGSLMFAAAFVKTGVDKRICLLIFKRMAKPSVAWVTAIIILVIAPGASFISDHALAAIFLPIGIVLYRNSLSKYIPEDEELAKLLMITIAMACNIGGFGAPSGGARNVIIMTYMEDMFGLSIGYGQWMIYGMPFVLIMMPITWFILNRTFHPQIKDLRPAMDALKKDIEHMGGWSRKQITAIVIFIVMFIGWVTESNIILDLTGIRLGIGVLAIAGAVAYLLTGIVNWRDYHEKVDWGVVWLYAGAIAFGRALDQTGAAYWIARSIVESLASIGIASGTALLAAGSAVTMFMTNLMADGPAAASVGPITLNMAAVASPGTTLVPFMGLATACASSMAYLLIIGTPPNAIVYSSGYLTARDFLRAGILCSIIAFIVLLLLNAFYWVPLGFGELANYLEI